MKLVMIGAGYVGLTTSACFASLGHEVTCVENDPQRIEPLTRGEIPIFEPGLDDLVRDGVAAGRLRFTDELGTAVGRAEAVFLAVGTPCLPNGAMDLSHVEAAVRQMARYLHPATLVVVKSTVVAGTARRLRSLIAQIRGQADIKVASNPEFLREGSALADFFGADRIVLGADEQSAAGLLDRIYRPLARKGVPTVRTSTTSAELIKYAANAFLALKIGFIDDVADLCEAAGGDIADVGRGIGLDRRIGEAFLSPGPGFGGSCFPKDTRAFADTGRVHGTPQPLVECLVDRNEQRKRRLAQKVIDEVNLHDGRTVAVLGIAFKGNTDDVRESAALTIVPMLRRAGLAVRAHDPRAARDGIAELAGIVRCNTAYEAVSDADAVVILTDWDEYRRLEPERLATLMHGRVLFDFRNLLDPSRVSLAGLRYFGRGRPEARVATATNGGAASLRETAAASPA